MKTVPKRGWNPVILNLAASLGCLASAPGQATAPLSVSVDWKYNREGSEGRGEEKVEIYRHTISLENRTSSPMGPLKILYRVYGHDEFGPDGKPEGPASFREKEGTVQALAGRTKVTFESDPEEIATGGVRIDANDLVEGVWIRVFDSAGNEVGSLMQPGKIAEPGDWKIDPPAGETPGRPGEVVEFKPPKEFANLLSSGGKSIPKVLLDRLDPAARRVHFRIPSNPAKPYDLALEDLDPECRKRLEELAKP